MSYVEPSAGMAEVERDGGAAGNERLIMQVPHEPVHAGRRRERMRLTGQHGERGGDLGDAGADISRRGAGPMPPSRSSSRR